MKGANQFELPSYLKYLAEDLVCFVSPHKMHATAWAEVVDNMLHVNVSKNGWFNILLFGDRMDEGARAGEMPVEYEEPETTVN